MFENPETFEGIEKFMTKLFLPTFSFLDDLSIWEDFLTLSPKTTMEEEESPLGAMDESLLYECIGARRSVGEEMWLENMEYESNRIFIRKI